MPKKNETKTLFTEKWFDVIEIDGKVGIHNKHMSVAVLPFTNDENGMVKEIGILHEPNPFREGGFCDTLITGTVEYEDDSLLLTAIRELEEEGGIAVPPTENARWIFLGTIYPYKDGDRMVPVFAVDVTGLEVKEPQGDGTEKEAMAKFSFEEVGRGIASDEALVLSSFLRLFNYMYAKSMNYV